MTSTITLYKDSKIIPSRNFVVEGIETYLAGLTKTTISDYQYLRNDLTLTIKINKAQIFTESSNTYNYNYLKVLQNGFTYYYFIVKKTQISQSTIAYELVMDTLNTYPWNTAFTPSNRTRVRREHKDRFSKGKIASICLRAFSISSFEIQADDIFYLEDSDGIQITCIAIRGESFDGDDYFLLDLKAYNDEAEEELEAGFIPVVLILPDTTRVNISESSFQDKLYNMTRIIDYYSEGITPVLYKKELGRLESKEALTWNLIYRNATNDENTAIQCFAVPSDGDLKIAIPGSKTLSYTDFEDGIHYLFAPWLGNYQLVDNNGKKYGVRRDGLKWICKDVYRSGTTLKIRGVHYYGFSDGESKFGYTKRIVYDYITITSLEFNIDEIKYYKNSSIPPEPNTLPLLLPLYNGGFTTTESTSSISTLEDVDRTEPKLIKIITIPYFPSYYSYSQINYTITTDETWTYENSVYSGGSLSLNNLNAHFSNYITSRIFNPLNIFKQEFNPSTLELRNDRYESKLYHSDFYQPKFIYDSFGFVFELEKIDEENFTPGEYFSFEFVMTSTINSKFMFKFPEYVLKMSTSDYDNILTIARNNEAPIYNSSYITYLRTAYRYDLKYLEQNKFLHYFNAGTGTLGEMLGTGSSLYNTQAKGKMTSGSGLIAGAQIGLGLSQIIAGAITSLNSDEWTLEAKKEALRNQANSVSGSDDLDLLENYSGNRAKLCLYEVSPRMKELLADLFYYFGYTTEEIKIPSINTRYWFNFLACELEFTGIDKNISDLCKEDLIARYNAGATFLHNHSGVWDFAQEKENWETSLL